jgi:hypothetical protein
MGRVNVYFGVDCGSYFPYNLSRWVRHPRLPVGSEPSMVQGRQGQTIEIPLTPTLSRQGRGG